MKCPKCNFERSNVIDSRSSPAMIRRRRVCAECHHRFTTYERIEESVPMLIKKDQRREPFDHTKVRLGILKACEKRPVSIALIDKMVQDIEFQISESDQKEISTKVVGEMIMDALRQVDQVAYVRFASVYREFSDVGQFVETLQGLVDEGGSEAVVKVGE